MAEALEQLLDSLLWEGYALYPYTPGATKNATPTPFGIVYPAVYAAGLESTFDHLILRCTLEARPEAAVRAELHFLIAGGDGHRATAQQLELPGVMVGALAAGEVGAAVKQASFAGAAGPVSVAMRLAAVETQPGVYELELVVENRTDVAEGLDRAAAIRHSLISAHPVLRVAGGRFRSPLERDYACVNTFPVLASDADDALIGAAIILPDHPQIAPESRGSLFDGTEIEEALLLHLRVLSDGERAEIERAGDPELLAMLARAERAGPEDIVALHGRTVLRDAGTSWRDPVTLTPPAEPLDLLDPTVGEATVDVGGKTFRQGAKVVIRPGPDADFHARMLDGRVATIERIFTAYDGRVHLGVTVDDDPGQELMRETGRFLYFFEPELEVA